MIVRFSVCAVLCLLSLNCFAQDLVEEGRRIFFEETFGGNGRTCSTCHRAEENFQIGKTFIATLPESDPLFADNIVPGFELRELLLKGLFEENQDGFDLPRNFRASPPLSGSIFIQQDPSNGLPHVHATGWSGDGSPHSAAVTGVVGLPDEFNGSLRDFIDGAILQHYILPDGQVGESLEGGGPIIRTIGGNVPRLATAEEKDALLAFLQQLQIPGERLFNDQGQSIIHWPNPYVSRGAREFSENRCLACHGGGEGNIGAMSNFGTNGVVNTGTFRLDPDTDSRTDFNIQPLNNVLAKDDFFHNNSALRLKDAIRFYDTAFFNQSPAADAVGNINLSSFERFTIEQFIRAVNVQTNLRQFLNPAVGELPMEELKDAVQIQPYFWSTKYLTYITYLIAGWGEFHDGTEFGDYLQDKARNLAQYLIFRIGHSHD